MKISNLRDLQLVLFLSLVINIVRINNVSNKL